MCFIGFFTSYGLSTRFKEVPFRVACMYFTPYHSLYMLHDTQSQYSCDTVLTPYIPLRVHSEPVVCSEPILVVTHKVGVCRVNPLGKECCTTFTRLSYNGNTSVVRCKPHTNNTFVMMATLTRELCMDDTPKTIAIFVLKYFKTV